MTVAFTTILWALFFGLDTYRAFSGREPIPDISHVVAIVNAAV